MSENEAQSAAQTPAANPAPAAPANPAQTPPAAEVKTPGVSAAPKEKAEQPDAPKQTELKSLLDDGSAKPEEGEAEKKDGEKKEEEPGKKEGAPEKYEFKAPDGMTLDTAAAEAFTPVLQKLGVNQEQAAELMNIYAGHVKAKQAEAFARQIEQKNKWTAEMAKDPKFPEIKTYAERALKSFGSPDFAKLVMSQASPVFNHPAIIRFLAQVGKAASEESFIGPAGNSGGETSFEKRMYGNTNFK